MNTIYNDEDFTIDFESKIRCTAYLSVSWQLDKGKAFGYQLIRRLDKEGVIVIGDTKGYMTMDSKRIERIMLQADCFVSVFPFRPESPCQTSGFMLKELEIAISLKLPVIVIYDSRIAIHKSNEEGNETLTFLDNRKIILSSELLKAFENYYFGVERSEELQLVELAHSILKLNPVKKKIQPYSFLITNLQTDFASPRTACKTAAEIASGIPCIWINASGYKTNIEDTVERARLLIKNAQFVIAEISFTDGNPDFDNPSRAHEIGLATAYGKKIFIVSHLPTRNLYHGLVARQLVWWDKEHSLFDQLKEAIYNERESIGRYVYNHELEDIEHDIQSIFSKPKFNQNAFKPWVPISYTQPERWIYAGSFSVLVIFISFFFAKIFQFDQTLDVLALFAGIITFFFSSSLNKKIERILLQTTHLKWLIPLLAILMLILFIWYELNITINGQK